MAKLLSQMNPKERFRDRAQDYANYRPTYPPNAIDCILNSLQDIAQPIAADVGAGTGISSRLLAERGIKVFAIEPNLAMQECAVPHPLIEFRNSSAEKTDLPKHSIDLIACFQSFHWFDPEPTLEEFDRILKLTGKLALVWNDRDVNGKDEFTREHGKIVANFANRHPAHSRLKEGDFRPLKLLIPNLTQQTFTHQKALNKESLVGLAMSTSYLPKEGVEHQKLVANLTELHDRYSDRKELVYLYYKTTVFLT
ncbi:class I SAM-dependent methyltransferase [Lusitaniella coriacea LEGE 07157]|uniref:Class I SAM-dependent methyltransferase n=1 Tax=Lusitaniella coriacea LEGE 07157 TaxID=945747 RepID=A0A8J7B766_9CYAN|nr:class I SAM-dependent methyltransferase [Lusitaniella coriacea]MBE9114976.1 class I SAM-dependent methyltransferase [Lusitaniella coriacea LEGE 07157]